jgi:hypothetical protein
MVIFLSVNSVFFFQIKKMQNGDKVNNIKAFHFKVMS